MMKGALPPDAAVALVALVADGASLMKDYPELCVSGPIHPVLDTQASKRSPNIIAN